MREDLPKSVPVRFRELGLWLVACEVANITLEGILESQGSLVFGLYTVRCSPYDPLELSVLRGTGLIFNGCAFGFCFSLMRVAFDVLSSALFVRRQLVDIFQQHDMHSPLSVRTHVSCFNFVHPDGTDLYSFSSCCVQLELEGGWP